MKSAFVMVLCDGGTPREEARIVPQSARRFKEKRVRTAIHRWVTSVSASTDACVSQKRAHLKTRRLPDRFTRFCRFFPEFEGRCCALV